jgi:hypothetical protein
MLQSSPGYVGYGSNRGDLETPVSEGVTRTAPIGVRINGCFHGAIDGNRQSCTQPRSPAIGTWVVPVPRNCPFPEGQGESLPAGSAVYTVQAFVDRHRKRNEERFGIGKAVLLFQSRSGLMPGKLRLRWTGPYWIVKSENGTYQLGTLSG